MRAAALMAVALLAGCVAADRPFPEHQETRAVPESASFAGIQVQGTLSGMGRDLSITALARNAGNVTYRVTDQCGEPWYQELYRGEERLQLHEPAVRCDALLLRDFAPGDEVPFEATWDGRYWDEGRGRYVAAPSGTYTWSARFVAYAPDGASGPSLKRFDLDFDVRLQR